MISVLATVDGSPESLAVIPLLERLASDMKAKFQLLTVAERPRATPRRGAIGRAPFAGVPAAPGGVLVPATLRTPEPRWAESDDQALERVLSESRDLLESAARPLRARGLDVGVEVLLGRDVAKTIANYAREHNFDLIAMATHGRGGLSDLVQGSVATAVLKAGVAPVLLTRPTKAQVRSYRASLNRAARSGTLELPAT